MQLSLLLLTALTTINAAPQGPPPDATFFGLDDVYPFCPENYDTYCCFTVVPYTTHCNKKTGCKNEPGWSCISGPGKVDSVRSCLEKGQAEGKTAYCKRPGLKYFPSILSWTGGSFTPVLEPSDYSHWVRPGMEEPWTPSAEEIIWEDEVNPPSAPNGEPLEDTNASELR